MALTFSNRTIQDILHITNGHYWISVQNFKSKASHCTKIQVPILYDRGARQHNAQRRVKIIEKSTNTHLLRVSQNTPLHSLYTTTIWMCPNTIGYPNCLSQYGMCQLWHFEEISVRIAFKLTFEKRNYAKVHRGEIRSIGGMFPSFGVDPSQVVY